MNDNRNGILARYARFVYHRRWIVLILSIVSMGASIAMLQQTPHLTDSFSYGTLETGQGFKLINSELSDTGGVSFALVFKSSSLTVDSPTFAASVSDAITKVSKDSRVTSVVTPFGGTPPSPQLISQDRHSVLVVVSLKDDFPTARAYYGQLRALISSPTLTITGADTLPITNDFDVLLEHDLQRAETVSLPLALILLLIVFGGVLAALLPLGVGVLAVIGGLGSVIVLSQVTDVSNYSFNIITLIGLGVAIDYSLFIVSRFREELDSGSDVQLSLERTLETSGRAIIFSGITVAIGLSALLLYQGTFLVSMGWAGTIVVALSVIYALTFLTALLAILGRRVNAIRVPWLNRKGTSRKSWHALATWVMRHPVAVVIPVLLVLTIVASPFTHMKLQNGGVNMLPSDAESRRGNDLLVSQFPQESKENIEVVSHITDGNVLQSRQHIDALYDLSRSIAALPHVLRVEGPFSIDPTYQKADYERLYAQPIESLPASLRDVLKKSVGKDIVAFNVVTSVSEQTDDARTLVRSIRGLPTPTGMRMYVSSDTAFDIDLVSYIVGRTPLAVGMVAVITYVVLFFLLRSVLLPLKAVLMNLLSLSASYGAMVWIFQDGHLSSLLGFAPAPIDPTLPVLIFAIVFGLSMDYEVFLLSRIQEEYRRNGNNQEAVAEGLERCGRLITGAAAIMVAVFSAFSLASVVLIKAIGLGMALAVLVDATLIRALMVPAVMRLMGRWNWWAPKWASRIRVAEH